MDVTILLSFSGFVSFAEFENIKASWCAFVTVTISTVSSPQSRWRQVADSVHRGALLSENGMSWIRASQNTWVSRSGNKLKLTALPRGFPGYFRNQVLPNAIQEEFSSTLEWSHFFYIDLFFLIYLFIYLSIYLFIYGCCPLLRVDFLQLQQGVWGYSSLRCVGFSLWCLLLLRITGCRHAGSVVVMHGPSCSVSCGILRDQVSNPCPLHWQADS